MLHTHLCRCVESIKTDILARYWHVIIIHLASHLSVVVITEFATAYCVYLFMVTRRMRDHFTECIYKYDNN